jgi:3-deoxy-manno-octulosonate cytidylyltransferase (CMP-KDO synthetase)
LELIELPITKLESIESLEQLRWLYFGYPIRLIETQIETPNVDTPEDLERILKTKSHLL